MHCKPHSRLTHSEIASQQRDLHSWSQIHDHGYLKLLFNDSTEKKGIPTNEVVRHALREKATEDGTVQLTRSYALFEGRHAKTLNVKEGDIAVFTVTRSGYTQGSSSIKYKTLKSGTAKEGEDYLGVNDILGFAPGEKSKEIFVQ